MFKKFRPIRHVIIIEMLLMLALAGVVSIIEPQSGISTLLGGSLFVIPNAYFTVLAFRYRGADMAHWIVKSFNRGQSGKVILTMVGFAVVFSSHPSLPVKPLMAAYCVMLILHIFVANAVSKQFSKL